jgi:hypothetical protein
MGMRVSISITRHHFIFNVEGWSFTHSPFDASLASTTFYKITEGLIRICCLIYDCVMYYRGSKRENMKCYLPFEVNWSKLFPIEYECTVIKCFNHIRGFKVFYNRRYLKIRLRAIRGPGSGSSWNLAFCGPKNVLQRLENIKCFWKKNPINFRVQISPRVKTMHPPPPISLLNISVYRLQPRLFIDSLP